MDLTEGSGEHTPDEQRTPSAAARLEERPMLSAQSSPWSLRSPRCAGSH
jgi:hypothetical protein